MDSTNREIIAEVPGNASSEGRLGLYREKDSIHFEYDGHFDGDDPESQLFIRGIASMNDYRKAMAELQANGKSYLNLTSGTLEFKLADRGIALYHRPGAGTGLYFDSSWSYEKLAICFFSFLTAARLGSECFLYPKKYK